MFALWFGFLVILEVLNATEQGVARPDMSMERNGPLQHDECSRRGDTLDRDEGPD